MMGEIYSVGGIMMQYIFCAVPRTLCKVLRTSIVS
jgi:hypothetical protein